MTLKKPARTSTKKSTSASNGIALRKAARELKRSSPLIRVKQSRIHGRGVYAAMPIRTGTKIIEYTGVAIDKEDESSDRYNDDLKAEAHTFLFYVDKDLTIDATDIDNPAKYINHSCEPNCESVIQGRRVYIKAIRPIKQGEELSYDYALFSQEDWKRSYWKRYLCRCGAYRCRGTILRKPRPPFAELVKWRRKYRKAWRG